jgi:hypothetical protein
MEMATRILGGSSAPVELTYEMWEPILAQARDSGEMRDDLDFRAISRWLTYLIILLLGRYDIEEDVASQRELLRTFVVPAFRPVPAVARARSSRPAGRARAAKAG